MSISRNQRRSRAKQRSTALVLGTVLAIGGFAITSGIPAPNALATPERRQPIAMTADAAVSLFSESTIPRTSADPETNSVELGLRFKPKVSGSITHIRFYKAAENSGPHTGKLWDSRGNLLTSVNFPPTTVKGWHTAAIAQPVSVRAGREYVASYRAPRGRYAGDIGSFDVAKGNEYLLAPVGAGVYTYGTGRPASNYRNSNYYVDVRFVPGGGFSSTPIPTATSTASPTRTVTPTPPAPVSTDAGWTLTASSVGLGRLGLKCADLPVYSGGEVVPRGTVISEQRITGMLDLSAGAITIERSCIQPTSMPYGMSVLFTTSNNTGKRTPDKVVIRDSDIDGSKLDRKSAGLSTAFLGVADLTSNYVHGFGSGLAIMNSGDTLDAVVERNYVTGLVAWGDGATDGTHSDAFTVRDFTGARRADRKLIIRNNRFDCNSGNDTGALFIQTHAERIDNVHIEGNLLEGLGYQLWLQELNAPYTNVSAVNNRLTGTGWGAMRVYSGPGWERWNNNYVYDANAHDGRGTTIPPSI